jgi:hypothetical protein
MNAKTSSIKLGPQISLGDELRELEHIAGTVNLLDSPYVIEVNGVYASPLTLEGITIGGVRVDASPLRAVWLSQQDAVIMASKLQNSEGEYCGFAVSVQDAMADRIAKINEIVNSVNAEADIQRAFNDRIRTSMVHGCPVLNGLHEDDPRIALWAEAQK